MQKVQAVSTRGIVLVRLYDGPQPKNFTGTEGRVDEVVKAIDLHGTD